MRDLMQPTSGRGKYEGELQLVERLHELSGDGSWTDDELFDESFGWWGLFTDLTSEAVGGNIGDTKAVILHESNNGFVSGEYFASDGDAKARWAELQREYGESDDGVDDDEDEG